MKRIFSLLIICFLVLHCDAMSQAGSGSNKSVRKKKTSKIQYGNASFYHNKFNGRKTASGERFSQSKLTCAHNGVPLGTWIRVTNLRNKKTVILKVNDRLARRSSRLVDLSRAAATKLGVPPKGLLKVKVQVYGKTRESVK